MAEKNWSSSSSATSDNAIDLDASPEASDGSDPEYFSRKRRSSTRSTKRPKARRTISSQEAREPNLKLIDSLGSIKSIQLINFMCHSNFEIKLGPKVNFIIGRNGSGKSAILSSILLALGARSSVTSRGSSVKKFIKKGETKARIIICLCNWNGDPDQSYKYEEYGKEIIVERTFAATSTYNIKSESGKVVSQKTRELKEILRHFAIQIDNPVVILNQEISRNFLNSKNAKDKYSFFMKATTLDELRSALTLTKNELSQAKETRKAKERVKADMEADAAALNEQVKALHSIDAMKDKISWKEVELKWAKLKQKESSLAEQTKLVASIENQLQLLEQSHKDVAMKIENLTQERDHLTAQSSSLESECTTANDSYRLINDQIERKKLDQNKIQNEIRQNTAKLNDINKHIKAFRDSIEKESNTCQSDVEAQIKERKIRMIEMKADIDQLSEDLKTKSSERDSVQRRISEQRSEVQLLKSKKEKINAQIRQQNGMIRDMKSAKTAAFGSSIWKYAPAINEKMSRAMDSGVFRVQPVGPLGAYITLTDTTCHVAVMAALKSLTKAYACDNNEDARKLRDIITSTTRGECPQIIVRRFHGKRFDVDRNKVQHVKYGSFVDLMKISDPNVFNVLIDQASLESIAYIPEANEATAVLLTQNTVPDRCRTAFSRDGTQFYPTRQHSVFRSYPYNGRTDNVFSRDVSANLRILQQQLDESKDELGKIQDEEKVIAATIQAEGKKLSELENEIERMRTRLRELRSSYSSMVEACERDKPVELTALQEELNDYLQRKETVEKVLDELNIEKDVISTSLDELTVKRNEQDDKRNKLTREKVSMQSKIREIQDKIIRARATSDERKIYEKKSQLEAENSKLDTLTSDLENEMALIGGERIVSDKRPEQLEAEIRELEKHVKEAESKIGSREELTARNIEVQKNLEKINDTCDSLDKCIASLNASLEQRRRLLYTHREKVCHQMKDQFKRCLGQLNYDGDLNIDHGDPKADKPAILTLSVNPKAVTTSGNSIRDQGYKDTRSLSGGERSYSTVAFLLALWEGCNSPFLILDEVDVFMDMITRQIAMDTLVNAAIEKGRQYIFLSPLPLIKDHLAKEDIAIHYMPEPLRGSENIVADTDDGDDVNGDL